jgi:hypothetical protein
VRLILPLLAFGFAILSVAIDFAKPAAISKVCLLGFCRFDELYASADAQGADLNNAGALLQEDPSNPSAWCSYAELLWKRGEAERARSAFAHAVRLGPGMSPVLMRAANFAFSQDDRKGALALSKRILHQTGAFDEVLFSYFQRPGEDVAAVLTAGLPAEPRAARAWLAWMDRNGTDQDIAVTFAWMKSQGLCDEELAVESVRLLWDRRAFEAAQTVWGSWVGEGGDDLTRERLFNGRFERRPTASPLDWKLEVVPSATMTRHDGVEIHFEGGPHGSISPLHQFATVRAGRYRFAAEIETRGLSDDARPFFHIFDAEPVRKVDVQTKAVEADAGRSWLTLDFNVPGGTRAVEVALEEQASPNSQTGALHVYGMSLVRQE